ncbi:uncharacterized protein NECHADRAFT_76030 [Fusarium vanettenii 77-13-4]|uniref:DUF7580 domain-containing protein n=1 Tax=Fusarium vanettenii (strain ATCC MYA-4622 / CBS 123669 / FGSC 9596 / NRRL 45880 / 77-13-4) TaxID=660122 RepID=C7Z6A1_FUSV7|nr:uncharacterized protein NECHADRAFT_76030 [Fusarium vanettenii 77-13-4]EEU40090.1 hypothetical protein NECHADRAFT_76030 [Fusarium vanettenii 77-13-4]
MEFIVGTVLAGVPIVLEAYDRYWDLSKGFTTFRHYSKELVKLDTILNTQKTLFRGNITKLLTAITNDPERARGLLSERSKETWETLKLETINSEQRLESLRDTFTSWKATLDQVLLSVTAICFEVESFRITNVVPVDSLPSRDSLKQLRKRFRLCWRKGEVQDSIKELRDFTADFNELTARIISELKELQMTPTKEPTIQRRASPSGNLDKYRQIQSASLRLYNTFAQRWCCTTHPRHAASISLIDLDKSGKSKVAENSIKFEVAIASEAGSAKAADSLIWLEVETVDTQTSKTGRPTQSGTSEKNDWEHTIQKITGHAHQACPKPSQSPDAESSANSSQTSNSDSIIDLAMIEDLCRHFQIPRPICSSNCVGYITYAGLHHFYLPPPERHPSGQQTSLAEIITWISEDEFTRSLPRTTMAHLASSLAAAVLQYHSTPWLPKTWESRQVLFRGSGNLLEDASSVSSTSPYFRVGFSTGPETTPQANTQIFPTPTPSSLARNAILFRLGIILLELGYSQPWPHLQNRSLSILPPQRQTDYDAAEKLAQAPLLRNRMGPRFSTIVRKCLGCDFGLGESDLASEELQGTFLVDVVEALQETERRLRQFEQRLGSGFRE